MIQIENAILEVLKKMQQVAPTYLSGGYLRDKSLNIVPNDIDILTEMTIEEVRSIIPNLQGTEKGLSFGVGRFSFKNFQFEVSSIAGKSLEDAILQKDFVMNSLYHDGTNLFDPFNALHDIEHGVIRSLHNAELHFAANPQAYLRAIRFCGQLGFHLDEQLREFLKSNPAIFFNNNESRIQQEGYKIIQTRFALKSLHCLNDLGIFPTKHHFDISEEELQRSFPNVSDKVFLRFLLLSEYTSLEFMHQFIDHFHLSKQLKEQVERFSPYLTSSEIPTNPHKLNTLILLKKLQYENNPAALQTFLDSIRKQKNGL